MTQEIEIPSSTIKKEAALRISLRPLNQYSLLCVCCVPIPVADCWAALLCQGAGKVPPVCLSVRVHDYVCVFVCGHVCRIMCVAIHMCRPYVCVCSCSLYWVERKKFTFWVTSLHSLCIWEKKFWL